MVKKINDQYVIYIIVSNIKVPPRHQTAHHKEERNAPGGEILVIVGNTRNYMY